MRVTPTGDMLLSIPHRKKWDLLFMQRLMQKWKILQKRVSSKKQIKRIDQWRVCIYWTYTPLSSLPDDLTKYLKTRCHKDAAIIADEISEQIWTPYNYLRIKQLKSKWWSCSSLQNININIDLIHLDPKFLRYVVIHEACHLVHKHHQQSFWNLVEQFSPMYRTIRKELNNIQLI